MNTCCEFYKNGQTLFQAFLFLFRLLTTVLCIPTEASGRLEYITTKTEKNKAFQIDSYIQDVHTLLRFEEGKNFHSVKI